MYLFLKQIQNQYLVRFLGPDDGGAGGDDGVKLSGDDGVKLSGKFIEKTDPVSGKKVKIPVEYDSVLGHFISKTREETERRFKPMLEALESEKADLSGIKAEYEKLKEASMTAEERAQNNAKKVIDEHEKKRKVAEDERDRFKNLFFSSTIRNEILSSFGDIKLCNPEQVAILFETEGGARPEELVDSEGKPTNRWGAKVKLMLEDDKGNPEEVEGSPKELFKRWIGLERNAHHVQNNIIPGGGSRQGTHTKGKTDFSKLPPKERIDAARQAQKN
jgi:hypothetical protein